MAERPRGIVIGFLVGLFVAGLASGNQSALTAAVKARDLGETQRLVSEGANLNRDQNNGEPLLFIPVRGHDLEMVRLLLKLGADPNRTDRNSTTALILAVQLGVDHRIVRALLASGSSIEQRDKYGKNAFGYAFDRYDGNSDMVRGHLEAARHGRAHELEETVVATQEDIAAQIVTGSPSGRQILDLHGQNSCRLPQAASDALRGPWGVHAMNPKEDFGACNLLFDLNNDGRSEFFKLFESFETRNGAFSGYLLILDGRDPTESLAIIKDLEGGTSAVEVLETVRAGYPDIKYGRRLFSWDGSFYSENED